MFLLINHIDMFTVDDGDQQQQHVVVYVVPSLVIFIPRLHPSLQIKQKFHTHQIFHEMYTFHSIVHYYYSTMVMISFHSVTGPILSDTLWSKKQIPNLFPCNKKWWKSFVVNQICIQMICEWKWIKLKKWNDYFTECCGLGQVLFFKDSCGLGQVLFKHQSWSQVWKRRK